MCENCTLVISFKMKGTITDLFKTQRPSTKTTASEMDEFLFFSKPLNPLLYPYLSTENLHMEIYKTFSAMLGGIDLKSLFDSYHYQLFITVY